MYQRALPQSLSHYLSQFVSETSSRNNTALYFTGCVVVPIDQSQFNYRKGLLPVQGHVSRVNTEPYPCVMKMQCTNKSDSEEKCSKQTIAASQVLVEALPCRTINLENLQQLVTSVTDKQDTSTGSNESISRGVKRHFNTSLDEKVSDSSILKKLKCDDQRSSRDLQNENSSLPTASQESSSILHSTNIVHNLDCSNDVWEKVSKCIWELYMENRQTEEMYLKKTWLRDALQNLLKDFFPYSSLYIVGSSLNGLGSNTSDLDLCMMLSHSEINQEWEATSILNTVLRITDTCDFVQYPQLICARVPILKFFDAVSGVEVDLNINNAVGIRNTQLLYCYAHMDWRVKPLVLLVKMWAKVMDINDARNMTLSSYSLVLMVIHFLQFGVSPPVIPCLQEIMPNKFHPQSDVRRLVLSEMLPPFQSNNKYNLGILMLKFLEYYGCKFQFSENVISVRSGGVLPKSVAMNFQSPKNKRAHWKYIFIEEPFDRTNTARTVFHEGEFHRILATFETSFNTLQKTKDLSSILKYSNST